MPPGENGSAFDGLGCRAEVDEVITQAALPPRPDLGTQVWRNALAVGRSETGEPVDTCGMALGAVTRCLSSAKIS